MHTAVWWMLAHLLRPDTAVVKASAYLMTLPSRQRWRCVTTLQLWSVCWWLTWMCTRWVGTVKVSYSQMHCRHAAKPWGAVLRVLGVCLCAH